MSHEILFANPVFQSGVNLVVFAGNGWMEASVGDELVLKQTEGDRTFCTATIVGIAHIPFRLIPVSWLAYAHDHNCHTHQGLLRAMQEHNPELTENHYVIVLFFQI